MVSRKAVTRSALGLLALGAMALAVGCGSSSGGSKSTTAASASRPKTIFTFLFAPRGFNDVSRAWANGWDQAKAQLGSRFHVVEKATGSVVVDPAAYLTFIRSALVQHPDGIVVVPNNGAGMSGGLRAIAAQGTKVLVMDQDVPNLNKVAFVGTNNKHAGAQAADYLIAQYQAHKLVSNQVAVLGSPPGVTSTDDRLAGFLSELKGSPLKVVATTTPSCGDSSKGRSTTADILTAHPSLGGVFSVCDTLALGAAQALKAAGKLDVQQASIDATTQGVQLILQHGGINVEIAQHLKNVGYMSVMTLANALDGKTVPPVVDTGTTVVTSANARQYLQTVAGEVK